MFIRDMDAERGVGGQQFSKVAEPEGLASEMEFDQYSLLRYAPVEVRQRG